MSKFMVGVAASAISALLGSAGYLGAQSFTSVATNPVSSLPSSQNGTIYAAAGWTASVDSSGHVVYYSASAGQTYTQGANGIITISPPPFPQGSAYHQVVDIYYDGDGNKLDAKSYTHRIDYDCNRNLRRQDENLMVQDDGKGNVRFVQSRLPSEPLMGVKPVTPEGMVKAQLAVKRSPQHIDPLPTFSTSQLAAAE